MTNSDVLLARVTGAIAGLLAAKGIASLEEFAAALQPGPDEGPEIAIQLAALADGIRRAGGPTFQVIDGGRDD